MKRATFAFLLIPIVCAASCARATASQDADGVPHQRVIEVGDGISVPSGPVLTALPPAQRYRFVSPESLAMGLGADHESSIGESRVAELRQVFSTVMGNGRWVESADSVQFDVTIFTTTRWQMRREARASLVMSQAAPLPCDLLGTPLLNPCTHDPVVHTDVWSTEYSTVYIIRRRSDGAVRVRRYHRAAAARARSQLATDLRGMLRAGEER